MTSVVTPATSARVRGGTAPPRWAVRTAHLIPLVVLPSGLWRVGIALGFSMGMVEGGRPVHITGWESVYVLSLSVVSEALALLSFGLVRRWGEVVPAWIPVIGGRRVPPLAAVLPAVAGSVALTAIFGEAAIDMMVRGGAEFAGGWGAALLVACYLPLLLWGPLLFALAVSYYRRHR
jgi:hypothetical protein